jgi:PAS domain S-box-containing protein
MTSDSPAQPVNDERRVLVLPATGVDGIAMRKVFAAHSIGCVTFFDMGQMCAALYHGAGALIVAEEMLLAEPRTLSDCVGRQPVWSNIPLIILSRSGHESAKLSAVLAELGEATVVERPIRTTTLVTLVKSSLRARERQYQVRQHLTEQERAQRTIREVEQRYRSLIDNITDYAVLMTDAAGRINSWNNGAEIIFGYTADDTRNKTLELLSTQDDIEASSVQHELQQARQEGRVAGDGWKMRKDGTPLYIEGVTVARFNDAGRVSGFAHFLRDVTEQHRVAVEREVLLDSERAARSEAERAGRIKDEFLATLSHELRTPLNAILGWTQVLKKTGSLDANAANAVSVIERNARSQAQIIADLLDMSSIISGKVRLEVHRLDLASVINATVETIRPAAQAKGIQLKVTIDEKVAPVRGDANRLQQVFWNLLTNAVKFTPKDGWVSITLAGYHSHLTVEVADNGEGMAPAFLPHIFDRFRQADASSTRHHGGLGLGLSIVKQLVELHGGSIEGRSSGPGKGSAFRVTLPLMSADETLESTQRMQLIPSSNVAAAPEIPAVSLERVKVLVVDDEPDARALVERLLRDCEAHVNVAGSVAEALRILEAEPPDVLVSDIGMPGEDGYSLIRRVRAMPNEIAKIPAIALTAYARTEDRAKAINAGFQRHLTKPVEPVELISMVAILAKTFQRERSST